METTPKTTGLPKPSSTIDSTPQVDPNDPNLSPKQRAEAYKSLANENFRNNNFEKALENYSNALNLAQTAIYYNNRATSYFRLEQYGAAIQDADNAIKLNPNYIKAYYRRAASFAAQGHFLKAYRDFNTASSISTKKKAKRLAREKALECQKLHKEKMLALAIAGTSDRSDPSVLENLDIDTVPLPKSFDGPQLNPVAKSITVPNQKDLALKLTPFSGRLGLYDFGEAGYDPATSPDHKLLLKTHALSALPPLYDAGIDENYIEWMQMQFKNQTQLPMRHIFKLLKMALGIISREPPLVHIHIDPSVTDESKILPESIKNGGVVVPKLTICGDIHGQYWDLMKIFALNHPPSPSNPYLMNGDWVDRGQWGIEVILTLLAYKCCYPNSIFFNRGNHETRSLTTAFGFQQECLRKFSQGSTVYNLVLEVFAVVPIASVVQNSVLVAHGGLFDEKSKPHDSTGETVTLEDISRVKRLKQVPDQGILCDILWSDPSKTLGQFPSKRGCGIMFGPDITKKFLKQNNLELFIRSHEAKHKGYEITHDGKTITIFSAPDYCEMGNRGAIIEFTAKNISPPQPKYHSYDSAPRPENYRPFSFNQRFM